MSEASVSAAATSLPPLEASIDLLRGADVLLMLFVNDGSRAWCGRQARTRFSST